MSFFMNPFAQDFEATWPLGDRQYHIDYPIPHNAGRGEEWCVSYGKAPFNLSGNDGDGNSLSVLTLNFALNDPKNWAAIQVTLTGATLSAVTAQEVLVSLQASQSFKDWFTATLSADQIQIKQNQPNVKMRHYVNTGRADTVLQFNKFVGIAEGPTLMARHTVANRFAYPDAQNAIIQLNPGSSTVDAAMINNAVDFRGNSLGLVAATVRADYLLLKGRSGIFTFRKNSIDAQGRIIQTIEYPAGAQAGDFAKLYRYHFASNGATNPDQSTEEPYTLQSADIITPA